MLEKHTPDGYADRFPFMTERSKKNVERLTAVFDAIIARAMSDMSIFNRKEQIINPFHRDLKQYCEATYGDASWWEQVPESQKLVGGSVEERDDITDEAFADIQEKIEEVIERLERLLEE